MLVKTKEIDINSRTYMTNFAFQPKITNENIKIRKKIQNYIILLRNINF